MHIPVFSGAAAARRSFGFTLTELMVVLAIGAVLSAVAAPSFKSTVAKYRMGTESTTLLDSLLLARDEARNSASPVSICASNDGATCSAGQAWQGGHIVFRDAGTAGVVDGTDAVLLRSPAAKSPITVKTTLQQGGTAFARGYLQFGGDGKLDIRTAIVFTTCQASFQPLLTAVQFNGSTSSSKGPGVCP